MQYRRTLLVGAMAIVATLATACDSDTAEDTAGRTTQKVTEENYGAPGASGPVPGNRPPPSGTDADIAPGTDADSRSGAGGRSGDAATVTGEQLATRVESPTASPEPLPPAAGITEGDTEIRQRQLSIPPISAPRNDARSSSVNEGCAIPDTECDSGSDEWNGESEGGVGPPPGDMWTGPSGAGSDPTSVVREEVPSVTGGVGASATAGEQTG